MKATFERPAKFQKDAPMPDRARAKEELAKREDFERELRRESDRNRTAREKKQEPQAHPAPPSPPPKDTHDSNDATSPCSGGSSEKIGVLPDVGHANEANAAANAEGRVVNAADAKESPESDPNAAQTASAAATGASGAEGAGEANGTTGQCANGENALDVANQNANTGSFNRPATAFGKPAGSAVASSVVSPRAADGAAKVSANNAVSATTGTVKNTAVTDVAHASDFRDFERSRQQGGDALDVNAPTVTAIGADASVTDAFRSTTSGATTATTAGAAAADVADARQEANIHAANMVTLARSTHAEVEVAGMGRIQVRANRRDDGVDIDIRAASVRTQAILQTHRVDLVQEVREVVRTGEVNIGLYDGSGLENASRDSSGGHARRENTGENGGDDPRVASSSSRLNANSATSSNVRSGASGAQPGRVRIVL